MKKILDITDMHNGMKSRISSKLLLILVVITSLFYNSCNEKKLSVSDYSDIKVLDSLIRATPLSNDTLFLGLRMNMSKNDYDNHIKELINEGKVTYSSSNEIFFFNEKIDLGAGYSYKTKITLDKYDNTTIKGEGEYILSPVFNEDENLIQFGIIIKSETWDKSYYGGDGWFETNIKKKYPSMKDENLKEALIDNGIIRSNDFIRQKENLVIHETSVSIRYTNLKRLYVMLFMKVGEKDIIKEETKDVIF